MSKKRSYQRSVDKKQNREIKRLKTDVKLMKKTVERKHWDYTYTATAVSTTALKEGLSSFLPYNTLDQARRQNHREGQSCCITRIALKGSIEMAQTGVSVDAHNRVRMLIVHTPDSTTPNLTDILEGPYASYDINAFNKIQPPFPYRILYDRTYNMQNGIVATTYPTEKWRHSFDIRLGKKALGKTGLVCDWIDSQANIQIAPSRGAITLFVYSDSALVSHPLFQANWRVTFQDL